jgi:two-component system LytT family sensor kinase
MFEVVTNRREPGTSRLDGSAATPDSRIMAGSFRVGPRLIAGVATALGVFSTFQAYNYVSLFTERDPSFPMLLLLNVTYWYAWALLVPAMLWMARRFRFDRHSWRRALLAHIPAVVVITALHAVITVSLRVPIVTYFGREEMWWSSFQELFFLNFDWEMMTYWAVVGASHAYDFHRESQAQKLTAAQLQTRLAEASLQSLQRQLHPHFLFNTLHTISALIHRDPEAADAMLGQLSDLLRLTLDRIGTQEVPLKQELDFVQKYVEIERTRFGDRLQVELDIPPETLDASVPNMILQPLVENAIRHGIARKVGGGRVDIIASRENGELHLVVRDTGPGIAESKPGLSKGVGLANTRSRLEHLFGERHRLGFSEPPGGGLAVKIVIPFTLDPKSHSDSDMESVA